MSLPQFENLNEAALKEVVSQRWPESQTLDFKKTLPGLSDREKSEFLKDVCGLANRDGGDLVYGIAEEDGAAKELSPIAGEAADAAKRRLGQVADAGLEPRLVGLQFKDIALGGGFALVVRVPASFNGPHRYTVSGVSRFSMRNGTYTTEMTYDQLRTAFDRTATLAERARRFREDRARHVGDTRLGKKHYSGPICLVQVIPIAAMTGTRTLDIAALYNDYTQFIFPYWGGATRSTNLDGLIVYPPPDKEGAWSAYTQVFRSGAFEAGRFSFRMSDGSRQAIPASSISTFVRDAIAKFLSACKSFAFSGPALAGLALFSVRDYEFALPQEHFDSSDKADRDVMLFPESWLDDIGTANVDDTTRPILDTLWQAFGIERCYMYDEKGNWRPR